MSLFRFPPQDPKPPYMECEPEHIKDAVWCIDNMDKYLSKDACDKEILLGHTIIYAIYYSVITGMFDFHPAIRFSSIIFYLQHWDHCKPYFRFMEKHADEYELKAEAKMDFYENRPTVCGVSKRLIPFI